MKTTWEVLSIVGMVLSTRKAGIEGTASCMPWTTLFVLESCTDSDGEIAGTSVCCEDQKSIDASSKRNARPARAVSQAHDVGSFKKT